jgi:hypothetical protein
MLDGQEKVTRMVGMKRFGRLQRLKGYIGAGVSFGLAGLIVGLSVGMLAADSSWFWDSPWLIPIVTLACTIAGFTVGIHWQWQRGDLDEDHFTFRRSFSN